MTVTGELPAPPADAAAVTLGGIRLFVLGIVDRQAEAARLTKQHDTLTKGITGLTAKLANENFVSKAPPELVERERERLARLQAELTEVEKATESLGT